MADNHYSWPSSASARIVGKRTKRLDGPEKSTGEAKYTYDINLPNQLIVRALGCPHAHCRIRSVDTRAAENVPGVVHVEVLRGEGTEVNWQGELLVAVAAESEGAAAEGVNQLNVDYEVLDSFTKEWDLEAAQEADRIGRSQTRDETVNEPGDDDDEDEFVEQELQRLFRESRHVVEGEYGIDTITHCCLEPHGSTVEWNGDKLKAFLSTQNVSASAEGFSRPLEIAIDDVEVECQYIGGGFGSKFAADYWGVAAATIARKTGRPVKFMLSRDQELKIAGTRPSAYARVKLGANADGVVQVWDSHHWGTSGMGGPGVSVGSVPYVYVPPNNRKTATTLQCNVGGTRAWRAPNHPQACALTQTAYDDLAREMGANSLEIFRRNLQHIDTPDMADLYRREMDLAAEVIGWERLWHPHGEGPTNGSVVEGLGMALHKWGGGANNSNCLLRISPDGSVQSFCGTQDLGTGTRTVCAMVLAETLGLDVDDVAVNIGKSSYPFSGASGGSTTVGAVSESHRRAAQDALVQLFERVAPRLEAEAGDLEAAEGRIRVRGNPDRGMSWSQACGLLGMQPLEVTSGYSRGSESPLSSSGVGGVQMAHVAVDRETGVVRMKKFVAVQDMGLIVNRRLAESQVYGAVIMGIAYALYEQRIVDPDTGAFVNAELRDYKLPRLGDCGEIVVRLYEPEDQRQRGVIGLGEPPVISPGAAISNAVCNALGVRVPVLPMTPQRVLEAIQAAGGRA